MELRRLCCGYLENTEKYKELGKEVNLIETMRKFSFTVFGETLRAVSDLEILSNISTLT